MDAAAFDEPPHRLRVRYCETDRMGVAHHGSYVAWFEEARTEWLRHKGCSYRELEDRGFLLQVVDFTVQYKKPVDYDDELLVRVRARERTNAAITLEYRVERADSGAVTAIGSTRLACVGRDGKVRRLPDGV
ncbi:MAG: acyl-CoA thioesterase [Planctomycetota bacterium]